ncbi:hypothetical protein LguiA_007967 [Lonicera macranthoides]
MAIWLVALNPHPVAPSAVFEVLLVRAGTFDMLHELEAWYLAEVRFDDLFLYEEVTSLGGCRALHLRTLLTPVEWISAGVLKSPEFHPISLQPQK